MYNEVLGPKIQQDHSYVCMYMYLQAHRYLIYS